MSGEMREPVPTQWSASEHNGTKAVSKRGRLLRWIGGSIFGLTLTVLLLPSLVASTPLRNLLLREATGNQPVTVSAQSASAAWWSPVDVGGLNARLSDESLQIDVRDLRTERTVLDLILARPEIGTVAVDGPRVQLQLRQDEPPQDDRPNKPLPPMTLMIHDGSLAIRMEDDTQPVVALDGLSAVARIENASSGSVVVIDPATLFDRRKLTPELCDRGLQLIAPVFAEAAFVSGDITIELNECRIPLGRMSGDERGRQMKLAGRLTLHDVETGLKNPMLALIAESIGRLTGGRKLETIRIANETRVDFRVEDGRVHHDGLVLMVPELSDELLIRTSGWVDLNDALDVRVTINLPAKLTADIPVLRALTRAPLEFSVTGTIHKPKLSLPSNRDVLDEIVNRLASPDGKSPAPGDAAAPTLPGAIGSLVEGLRGQESGKPDVEKTARGILNIIRATRDKKKAAESPPSDGSSSSEADPSGKK